MILVLLGTVWLLLGILLAVRFRDGRGVSRFELTRLSGQGDKTARERLERRVREPELESLRTILVTVVSTLVVTTSVLAFGLWRGIVAGVSLLILAPVLVRLPVTLSLADRIRDLLWPYALKICGRIGPLLRFLRERDAQSEQTRVYSQDELVDIIHRSRGVLSDEQQRRLQASLRFDERRVTDVMTPKSMIVAADIHDTLGPLVMHDLHASGHSRFPVVNGDIDHIAGILYLKELIDLKTEHQTVQAAMDRKVYYIREDQSLKHALRGFLHAHHHLFVVVNEYRETVGLLSLEDVIEALIGSKIVDESDEFDDLRAVAEQNPRKNNHSSRSQDI